MNEKSTKIHVTDKSGKQDVHGQPPKSENAVKSVLIALVMAITVISAIIIYHFFIQKQIVQLEREAAALNHKLKEIETGKTPDLSVQQLAEKLDFVANQQEVTLTATQAMIDYFTFTFTLIGVFFLLVSGYFIYRQYRSEKREEEGWMLAKGLLELVTASQQFVVEVQKELQKQQQAQLHRQEQTKRQLTDTVSFLNTRADLLINQFNRNTVSQGFHFTRLMDISNRIDNTRFQLPTFDLVLSSNCYFLKAVYEYIIGNYNAAREEFDTLIQGKEKHTFLDDNQLKQLSLCYYYRGLIEYNIQGNLLEAEKSVALAIAKDPQLHGFDYKSMLLKAEIKFKMQNPEAFDEYKKIALELNGKLKERGFLSDTQELLHSYAYLGMVYCKILGRGRKFLPTFYESIRQLDEETILEAVKWLKESENRHFYTFLTLGQLSAVFENTGRNLGLESTAHYFSRTYDLIEDSKPYEKEETRQKILAYTAKLVCEKFLNKPALESTKQHLKNLLDDRELRTIYSIFSKVNVSKAELIEELKAFGTPVE